MVFFPRLAAAASGSNDHLRQSQVGVSSTCGRRLAAAANRKNEKHWKFSQRLVVTRILGDELHIVCQCQTTKVVLNRFIVKFQRLTRLLDLPSLTSFSAEETTRLVLGNYSPQILQKDIRRWIPEGTPLCCEYAHVLRTHHMSGYNQLLLTCPLMMRTQHRQTITTISQWSSPPWLLTRIHITNQHHDRIPRPLRSTAHWASYPLQMAHVWLVPWPHIRRDS